MTVRLCLVFALSMIALSDAISQLSEYSTVTSEPSNIQSGYYESTTLTAVIWRTTLSRGSTSTYMTTTKTTVMVPSSTSSPTAKLLPATKNCTCPIKRKSNSRDKALWSPVGWLDNASEGKDYRVPPAGQCIECLVTGEEAEPTKRPGHDMTEPYESGPGQESDDDNELDKPVDDPPADHPELLTGTYSDGPKSTIISPSTTSNSEGLYPFANATNSLSSVAPSSVSNDSQVDLGIVTPQATNTDTTLTENQNSGISTSPPDSAGVTVSPKARHLIAFWVAVLAVLFVQGPATILQS
ncbi:hypothetical protein EDC01DRAFT_636294 [Geopyxis carbonaria]|nr:hypothetical protein EDC01DRAFT_636294 [Geopyxis carbonaria]